MGLIAQKQQSRGAFEGCVAAWFLIFSVISLPSAEKIQISRRRQ